MRPLPMNLIVKNKSNPDPNDTRLINLYYNIPNPVPNPMEQNIVRMITT